MRSRENGQVVDHACRSRTEWSGGRLQKVARRMSNEGSAKRYRQHRRNLSPFRYTLPTPRGPCRLSTFSLVSRETRPYSRREKRTEHDPRIPHRPPTRRCRPGKEKEKRPIGTISIRGTRPKRSAKRVASPVPAHQAPALAHQLKRSQCRYAQDESTRQSLRRARA